MNHHTERLFLALPFDSREQKEFLSMSASWKHHAEFRKWTHPDDSHITLHFLGDISTEHQTLIGPAVRKAVEDITAFNLCLDKTGVFGQPTHPSVLWLGPTQTPPELTQLYAALGQQLQQSIGYMPESRPYSPHLTLARKYAGEVPFHYGRLSVLEPFCWEVREAVLYRSKPGHHPMYEIIERYPFN
ncbi:RNA 2',3'-cyclic phosphodiesterase [Paenibacillus sp. GCM10012307]|uniref:RNA 2',3'-cyclic phosphodiesterase n=1 Tax=Paenibacillus roseus TaxID=2798579 RepID=A0A934J7K3_9BACL|nr:RNA 2',3'-cyclic phosphodiesterase [Paenibacillus roseus]MBJ6362196.1 RNA 2',3'-cyclic phosphodiesterase [Paenibacillus roseus]